MLGLRDRHILVLGGSDGIGLAAASFLLRAGSVVTVCGRDTAKLERAVAHLRALPGVTEPQLRFRQADATRPEDVEAAVRHALDADGRIQAVLIVAGAGGFRPVLENSNADILHDVENNIFPLNNALRAAVPLMGPDGGNIVAISSLSGWQTSRGLSSYGAAKSGLDHYVRVAADELGRRNIRINSILPGLVNTTMSGGVMGNPDYIRKYVEQIPLGRHGEPEDLAAAIALFLSPASSWITGQSLLIDGGEFLRSYPSLGQD